MVGLCGGYTTFSAFSLQTLALVQDGAWVRAGAYIVASVVLCLVAVWAGYAIAHMDEVSGAGRQSLTRSPGPRPPAWWAAR